MIRIRMLTCAVVSVKFYLNHTNIIDIHFPCSNIIMKAKLFERVKVLLERIISSKYEVLT